MLPPISDAAKLSLGDRRLLIAAYGFEDRSLGWTNYQKGQGRILTSALLFHYNRPKGDNRITELQNAVAELGVPSPSEVTYDYGARFPGSIEEVIDEEFDSHLFGVDEVVLDISAMSKLLILISLCKLSRFRGTLRIVCCEAEYYAPTEAEYKKFREEVEVLTKFPSQGVETIVRTKCLSSIRMQGQPVTLVAFTSFNEQLIRHLLGTITPHRLLFINGQPPRPEFAWREEAIQRIHSKVISEYPADNPLDSKTGLLSRVVSTLDYRETVQCIDDIYRQYGLYERIICAATGSKMQTVGLFLNKIKYPDIHIEYPTPNSYFVSGMTMGVRSIHEVVFQGLSDLFSKLGARSISGSAVVN